MIHRGMIAEDSTERLIKRAASTINPDACREYYDLSISECPAGLVVLFGAWGRDTVVDTSDGERLAALGGQRACQRLDAVDAPGAG
jgi:hypothetical protein